MHAQVGIVHNASRRIKKLPRGHRHFTTVDHVRVQAPRRIEEVSGVVVQCMRRKWVPEDSGVMEFGARFGTTTCEIANKQGNTGKLVSFEPDGSVLADLENNLENNNCKATVPAGQTNEKMKVNMQDENEHEI